jgi:hypothetical protein
MVIANDRVLTSVGFLREVEPTLSLENCSTTAGQTLSSCAWYPARSAIRSGRARHICAYVRHIYTYIRSRDPLPFSLSSHAPAQPKVSRQSDVLPLHPQPSWLRDVAPVTGVTSLISRDFWRNVKHWSRRYRHYKSIADELHPCCVVIFALHPDLGLDNVWRPDAPA